MRRQDDRRLSRQKAPNPQSSQLLRLSKNLQQLGAPDRGVVYLRVVRHSGKLRTVQLIRAVQNVSLADFQCNEILDSLGAPEFGVINLQFTIGESGITNIKVLGSERSIDLSTV